MRTSYLLPRDLSDIIFRSFLQMCWLARPTALANIRKHLNLTQNNVGDVIGATRITISGWESGKFLPIAENAYRYWNALLEKSRLDGKPESWLIDQIFAEIPELYDAIPKMHDAKRYAFIRERNGSEWSESAGSNQYLDKTIDEAIKKEYTDKLTAVYDQL